MESLKHHLAALSHRDLRGIAIRLGVRQSEQNRKIAWVEAIVQLWHDEAQRRRCLQQFSPQALAALRRLIGCEAMPAALFLAEYGEIRYTDYQQHWAPAPWQEPATPGEELYYSGILCLPITMEPPRLQLCALPIDLRPLLADLLAIPHPTVLAAPGMAAPGVAPHAAAATGRALCHDLGQLLIFCHEQALRSNARRYWQRGRWFAPWACAELNRRLLQPEAEPLPRSHKQMGRLRLLTFLATAAQLLEAGALTPLAWAWLNEPLEQQLALLWRSWQTTNPDVRAAYAQPDAHLPAPWPAPLLAALCALPEVFSLADVTAQLLAGDPALHLYWVAQLPDLSALDQLAAATLSEVLAPLGMVQRYDGALESGNFSTQFHEETPWFETTRSVEHNLAAVRFQITPVAHWLLDQPAAAAPTAAKHRVDDLWVGEPTAPVHGEIGADEWQLQIPATRSLWAQAKLAPYRDYVALLPAPPYHCYRLNGMTLGRAAATGLGLPDLAEALTTFGIPLPGAAWRQLHAWHEEGQALKLGCYPLLRTTTAKAMQALHATAPLRPLWGELLSPTTVLLNRDLAVAVQQLQQAGFPASAPLGVGLEPESQRGVLWLAGQVYALLGQHLALPLPPPFGELQSLFQSLPPLQQALLQSQLAQFEARLCDMLDNLPFTPPHDPSDPEQWRPLIEQATTAGRNLQIDYFSAGRNLRTRRLVEPYWVEEQHGALYLRAYCHQAGQVLTFRLDRIQAAELDAGESVDSSQ